MFLAMKALSLQFGAHEMSCMNIVGTCLYALDFTTVHVLHYLPQLLRKENKIKFLYMAVSFGITS
jgi:hypothetical protein